MPELNVGINAKGSTKGAAEANKAINSIRKESNSLDKATGKTSAGLAILGRALPVAAVATGLAALGKATVSITDKYTNYASQLEYVTGSTEGATNAMEEIFRMSQKTATSVDSNTQALVLLSQANEMTGNKTADNVLMLEKLNILMKKTGVSTEAGGTALLQLSQALASGTLAGDEFKSISEAFPALMGEIAKSLGIAKGELKGYASEGKLTADVVVKAIKDINAGHEGLPKTAEAGWQKVINSWNKALASIGLEGGVSELLFEAFSKLSGWMDNAGAIFGPGLNYLSSLFSVFWDQVKEPLQGLINMLRVELGGTLEWLKTDGAPLLTAFGEGFKIAFKAIGIIAKTAVGVIKVQLESVIKIIKWVMDKLNVIAQSKIFQKAQEIVGGAIDIVAGEQETKPQAAQTTINNNFNTKLGKSDILNITLEQQRQMARA